VLVATSEFAIGEYGLNFIC